MIKFEQKTKFDWYAHREDGTYLVIETGHADGRVLIRNISWLRVYAAELREIADFIDKQHAQHPNER